MTLSLNELPRDSLPTVVKLEEDFLPVGSGEYQTMGSGVELRKGEILTVHFVREVTKIHTQDQETGAEFYIPLHCQQLFERLPRDPRHDDKLFLGAGPLFECDPLPEIVRSIDNFLSSDEYGTLEENDIVYIHGLDSKLDHWGKRVILGVNQDGREVHIHEHECSCYMVSIPYWRPEHMTEITKLDMPQRVRIPAKHYTEVGKEKVLKLLELQEQEHYVVTKDGVRDVLSIPAHLDIRVSIMPMAYPGVLRGLTSLQPCLNLTLNVRDVGLPPLPPEYDDVPLPLPDAMDSWRESWEGKQECEDLSKKANDKLKEEMALMQNHIAQLKRDLENSVPIRPPEPLPRNQVSLPPPRPPKPKSLRGDPIPPTSPTSPTTKSEKKGLKKEVKTLLKKVPSLSFNKDDKPEKKEKEKTTWFAGKETSEGAQDGEYEDVENVYDELDEVKVQALLKELREQISKKEGIIRGLKSELEREKGWKKKYEDLEKKHDDNVQMIHDLQTEVDRLLVQQDEGAYDTVGNAGKTATLPEFNRGHYDLPVRPGGIVETLSIHEVVQLLSELNLQQYKKTFEDEQIDGELLSGLDEDMCVKELGMSRLHALRLLKKVGKRKAEETK
ncbi:uncharacterized protein LOC118415783 [Branchiostoma floridae]|uniref:Uncharacterized protein LOC118415783 n=1 Tax=Branchiostoma floridae TaxID=7739 RepID=A0A9J7L6J2_BRAFL|nr:uncharacterized protein LOC118415783 [Branchiostoma floridae]